MLSLHCKVFLKGSTKILITPQQALAQPLAELYARSNAANHARPSGGFCLVFHSDNERLCHARASWRPIVPHDGSNDRDRNTKQSKLAVGRCARLHSARRDNHNITARRALHTPTLLIKKDSAGAQGRALTINDRA